MGILIREMTKNFDPDSGRPQQQRLTRTSEARTSLTGDPAQLLWTPALSARDSLVPRSCAFYEPDVAVATFEVNLAAGDEDRQPPHDVRLVKAGKRRHAIDFNRTIRLCTPGYYREDGESLIWDLQEGVISSNPKITKRKGNRGDLSRQERFDEELSRSHPFRKAVGEVGDTDVFIGEKNQLLWVYGDNCLIWCPAIEPSTEGESRSWLDSLDPAYNYRTTINNPHLFAEALGAMVFNQKSLVGDVINLLNPRTGKAAECPSLPVIYGPVAYVDDRRGYIMDSQSDLEFVVRSIFAKSIEHQYQREYRFAILTNRPLKKPTLKLEISEGMRQQIKPPRRIPRAVRKPRPPVYEQCRPPSEVLECFSHWPPRRSKDRPEGSLEALIQPGLRMVGSSQVDTTISHLAIQKIKNVDYQRVEQALADEPTGPSDARIAKLIFDAGPGSVFSSYSLDDIFEVYEIVEESGVAKVRVATPMASVAIDSDRTDSHPLYNFSEFDGVSILSDRPKAVILFVETMNPAARVSLIDPRTEEVSSSARFDPSIGGYRIRISETEDTAINITARSVDGKADARAGILIRSSLWRSTRAAAQNLL